MSILGLECGASVTTAILQFGNGQVNLEFGPANYSLMSHTELDSFLQKVKKTVDSECKTNKFPPLVSIGIGMPGILTEEHKKEVTASICGVWSEEELDKIWVGSDIEVAFSYLNTRSKTDVEYTYQILFISGTGSVVFGKAIPANEEEGVTGRMIKVGGAGHIIGDRGSGYAISLQALRSAFKECEYTDSTPPILQAMMKTLNIEDSNATLNMNSKDCQINKSQNILDLIEWSVHASKAEIASLAKTVLEFWVQDQDEISSSAVLSAIDDLSSDFKVLMKKLLNTQRRAGTKERILIGFTGSLLTECPNFSHALSLNIENTLRKLDTNVSFEFDVVKLRKSSAQGALRFLQSDNKSNEDPRSPVKVVVEKGKVDSAPFEISHATEKSIQNSNDAVAEEDDDGNIIETEEYLRKLILPTLTALPTTEMRNEKSTHLDNMPILEAIELMLREEQSIYKQIRKELGKIGQLVLKITKAFKNGGRLFYCGAGTSGRLGILDASEIPPTFKAPHSWVQGIIAGGHPAVFKSVEAAEDSCLGGALAIRERELNENDVLLGIAASGRTPFVWGALYEAKKAGAYAALLTFNPNITVNLKSLDMIITVTVGPEVLTGSSRLKSGSATKCILNMLTTLSMCRYGKCLENLMVDLNPTNDKLRDRAARIVLCILQEEQPLLTKEEVVPILKAHEYDIKKTVQVFRSGISSTENPDVQNGNTEN